MSSLSLSVIRTPIHFRQSLNYWKGDREQTKMAKRFFHSIIAFYQSEREKSTFELGVIDIEKEDSLRGKSLLFLAKTNSLSNTNEGSDCHLEAFSSSPSSLTFSFSMSMSWFWRIMIRYLSILSIQLLHWLDEQICSGNRWRKSSYCRCVREKKTASLCLSCQQILSCSVT